MSLNVVSKRILARAKLYEELQRACRHILKTHSLAEEARLYIDARISYENQELFNVGYFPDDDNLDILFQYISEEKLKILDIVYPYHVQDGDNRAWTNKAMLSKHNITMPYRNIYGNIVALVGRTILSEDDRKDQKIQKYKYTKFNKSLHLFGLSHAKEAILRQQSVIIVEGQIDCITCHEYGIHNVVALGGAALGKYQFRLLNRLAKKIVLLLDNDAEGKKAQKKIIDRYSKEIDIAHLELPGSYKDVDQYLRTKNNGTSIFV